MDPFDNISIKSINNNGCWISEINKDLFKPRISEINKDLFKPNKPNKPKKPVFKIGGEIDGKSGDTYILVAQSGFWSRYEPYLP